MGYFARESGRNLRSKCDRHIRYSSHLVFIKLVDSRWLSLIFWNSVFATRISLFSHAPATLGEFGSQNRINSVFENMLALAYTRNY